MSGKSDNVFCLYTDEDAMPESGRDLIEQKKIFLLSCLLDHKIFRENPNNPCEPFYYFLLLVLATHFPHIFQDVENQD